MRSSNKDIGNWKQWLDYLRSKISGRERNVFERELEKDEFSREAAEGFSLFDPELLNKDLENLERRLGRRVRSSQKRLFLRIAASIVILLGLGFAWIAVFDTRLPDFFADPAVTQNLDEPVKTEKKGSSEEVEEDNDPPADESEYREELEESTEVRQPAAGTNESLPPEDFAREKEETADIEAGEIPMPQRAEKVQDFSDTDIRKIESRKAADMAKRTLSGVDIPDAPASDYDRALIQGRVISAEDKNPVPGANVMISGTKLGTVTDMEGQFTLEVDDTGEVSLTTQFIGMYDQTVTTSTGSNVEIQLEPDVSSLDEVVIIGYGSSRKSDVTGAVETINMEELNQGSDYVEPLPEGGYNEFRDYISENLVYPDGHEDRNREVVVLRFTLSKIGRPENIVVLRSPGHDFSAEAIRLLEKGPDWNNASMNGMDLPDISVKVRIVFKKE